MKVFRNCVFLLALFFVVINNGYGADKITDSSIVATYDNNHPVTMDELHQFVTDLLYYKKYPAGGI